MALGSGLPGQASCPVPLQDLHGAVVGGARSLPQTQLPAVRGEKDGCEMYL